MSSSAPLLISRMLLVLCSVAVVNAGPFLDRDNGSIEIRKTLLEEIDESLGGQHRRETEARIPGLEAMLRPMLATLPTNEHGRFDHAAVRYALHRLLVNKHAWFVDGLSPIGEDIAAARVDAILNRKAADAYDMTFSKDVKFVKLKGVQAPELLQNIFEARLGSHGLDTHEVSILAAIFENLASTEATMRLEHAYLVEGINDPSAHMLTSSDVDGVLDTYMSVYIIGLNLTKFANQSELIKRVVNKSYPGWPDVQTFVRDSRKSMTNQRSSFSFNDVKELVHTIGDAYGRWQDTECVDLKALLLGVDDDGTGRVSIYKFYDAALNHGKFQFRENIAYLRQIGALDESSPEDPKVIVPNYILSPSNCIASSSYYSVCCIDECESLMGAIEQEINAPEAYPAQIAKFVATLPATYTAASRELSPLILQRLSAIAKRNGGMVPLHGRLFAQWMHHAYPRECPYPHVSGTTSPMKRAEFKTSTGLNAVATKDEMQQILDTRAEKRISEEYPSKDEITWDDENEFYVPRALPKATSFISALLRGLAALGVAFASAFSLFYLYSSITGAQAVPIEKTCLGKYI